MKMVAKRCSIVRSCNYDRTDRAGNGRKRKEGPGGDGSVVTGGECCQSVYGVFLIILIKILLFRLSKRKPFLPHCCTNTWGRQYAGSDNRNRLLTFCYVDCNLQRVPSTSLWLDLMWFRYPTATLPANDHTKWDSRLLGEKGGEKEKVGRGMEPLIYCTTPVTPLYYYVVVGTTYLILTSTSRL